jgi:aminoglycoside/choline kinase family phosphotransferase
VDKIFRRLFQRQFGSPPASMIEIAGDGSPRQMFRLVGEEMETAIAVVGPDAEENRAFLSFTESFRSIGLPVPQVYQADEGPGSTWRRTWATPPSSTP